MKRIARLSALFAFCLIASRLVLAQNNYLNIVGSPSFNVQFPVENGFINIANGNLHLEFPLATHKQRGALQLNERLVYDSRIWMIGHYSNYYWWPNNIPNTPNTQGGWRFVTGNETGSLATVSSTSQVVSDGCPVPPYNGQDVIMTYTMAWNDPSGTLHTFTGSYVTEQNDCNGTYTQHVNSGAATDASGYQLQDDGNGNPVVVDNDGTQVYPQVIDRFGNYWSADSNGNLIDDLGRTPVIVTKNGNVTYYDVLAPNGPINNNGTRVRYTVTTAPVQIQTSFQQPLDSGGYVREWPDGGNGLLYPVQNIQLPDGTSYSFTYDSYGEMTSVTLPTGGTVQYGWTNYQDSYQNKNRWLTSRTVGSNPSTTFTQAVLSQCSSNGTGCQEQVTVHKPNGDETVYQLTLVNGSWNTNVAVYSGAAGGTPLATTANTYSYSCSGCSSLYITKSQATTTLASGLTTQTQYVYTSPQTGKMTALKEWNYYTGGAPQTPTKETDYSYNGFDLHQVTVLDNGVQSGQTTYDYTTSATTTSGVPQHGTANAGGPYLQKVTQWLNNGTSPYTTYVMDDTGMVTSIIDPKQNPASTISYQCSNSLPFQTVNPLGHTTTYQYDCNSGAIISVKDPNDAAANRAGTTYQYEATAGRVQSISYPDGGQTTYSYPSSTEVDTSVVASPNPAISSQSIVDSFGRPYQQVQAGISTETTYDVNGRAYCTTNPHFISSSSSTDGSICITQYDGLDRPLTQSQSDGTSTISWSYNGNTTTFTDEASHSWQRTSDIFGRLTKVIEPNAAETDYSYNVFTTSVSQPGINGEAPRAARTFTTDSLGRTISVTEPERGTTSYVYDNNGNPSSTTDARGITTTYTYDALNRLTTQQASGINDAYSYDSGPWVQNGIGRLVQATNMSNADEIFSYDPIGRVNWQSSWTPQSPNHTGIITRAQYDLAGNMTSLTYPDGRTVTQGFDGSGRISSVNYAGWNGNGKSYSYLSNAAYDPTGHLVGGTMGNGIGIASKYDARQHINMLGYGSTSQLLWGKGYQWYPNGNLQSVTDAFSGIQRQFGYDNLNRLTAAQDIIGSTQGANTTPFASGVGVTYPSAPGATTPPQWTDPDDSNMLINADTPGANGWGVANATLGNSLLAPDGTMTASSLTANSGSTDSYIAASATNQYLYDNETMTGSVWLRSPNGAQTVDLFLVELGSAGYDVPAAKQVTVTSTWQQFSLSGQYHYGHNQILFQIGGGATLTSGQTIQLWGPKLEDTGTSGRTVTNFAHHSQRINGGNWGVQAGTAIDNAAVAPDGSNTAALVTSDSSSTDSWIINEIPNPAPFGGLPVTGSIWLRSPSGPQNLLMTLINVGQNGFNTLSATTITVTSDWQRFQVTGTNQSALTTLELQIGGANTFTHGQAVQVWGAQLELASSAGPYVPTGDSPASTGTNFTNILPYSQQPNTPSWGIARATGAVNAVSAPDGSMTGYELTASSGSIDSFIVDDVVHPALYNGATVTGSIFLRSPGGSLTTNFYLVGENASGRTYIGPISVPLSASWKRFSLTGQMPNGLTRVFIQVGGGATFTSGQIDIWGAQLELASSAGPYVPTSALPVLAGQELTNILLSSQQVIGPSWGAVNSAIVNNSATAPDGTMTASTVTANTGSTDSYVANGVPNPSLYDNQTVTGSVYLRVPSGPLNTNLFLVNIGESGFSLAANVPITVTSTWQRFSITGTNQNGLTTLIFQIAGGSTLQSGQSLQIWGAQLVVGSSPAPYTPTPTNGGATNIVTGQPATLVQNGLNQTYQYDSFGNILQNGSFNDNYTANNQLIGYAYDASGNLLSNGLTVFSWDAEGRMQTGGGATYIYDAMRNRVSVQGLGITDTVYFGGVPIARFSAGTWTDMIYGPQGLIAEVAGSENADPQYRLADHLGSSVGQVASNGIVTDPMDYTPFGQPLSGSTDDPYQYAGLERDQETGLDHATFRQYSSSMGRWYAPDPYLGSMDFANPQSLNRYAYVGNSPLTATDPSGLNPCAAATAFGAAFGGPAGGTAGTAVCIGDILYSAIKDILGIASLFSHPSCRACDHPRPQNGSIWDEHGGFQPRPYSSIASMIGDIDGLYSPGCEFGSCGAIGDAFQQGRTPVQNQSPFDIQFIRDAAGRLMTIRIFDWAGRAWKDIDFHDHPPGRGPGNPHQHPWNWNKTPPRLPGGWVVPYRIPGPLPVMVPACMTNPTASYCNVFPSASGPG